MIRFLRKPRAGLIIAVILLFGSFLSQVPLWIAELLRALTGLVVGLVVHNIWQNKVIEEERREERTKIIEEFTGLHRLGLKAVLPERDSKEIGKKNFDFLERLNQFQPEHELILVGITTGYLPQHISDQIRSFLERKPTLKLKVCVLDPDSPCVTLRSQEVFQDKNETQKNINNAIAKWKKLQRDFSKQIILKKSKTIPYGEYEAVDVNKEKGLIYYTPICYKTHTNTTPSFLFSNSKSALYKFHKEVIEKILEDADDII